MKMRPIILIFALVLLAPTIAKAQTCELTIYCEYPPPNKEALHSKGALIYDEVWELMRRTGIKNPIEQVTWKRGYAEATTKPCLGLFPTTRTAEREALFHWVGPILRVEWVFYAHADSGIIINSLADAKAVQAIGTYANDSKEQWLRQQGFTNLKSVIDNPTNLKKLYDHRIDLMVGSPSVTDRWPEQYGFDPSKFVPVYKFKTVDLYLAVSLGTPEKTVKQLKNAFEGMLRDKTVHALYKKWVPGLTPPKSKNK